MNLQVWKCFSTLKNQLSSKNIATKIPANEVEEEGNTTEELDGSPQNLDDADCGGKLSFISILKIGFVKLVKLNLTSIFTFTFRMVHCVEIAGLQYLYLYAEHQCYSYWQYIIIFGVLPIVLLFPAAFGFSLNLLKQGCISTREFLIASSFPYYALWLYGKT